MSHMTREREMLVDAALRRANRAHQAYKLARDFRQAIQEESPHYPQADGGYALRRALMAETAACAEWRIALDAHHDLIVKGKRPE